MKLENERGFTLIEMMIVVAIIAILVAILVPNFIRARAQAQTASCEANLKEIATVLELYQTDHQQYPAVSGAQPVTNADPNLSPYMKQTPVDPANPSGQYTYQIAGASGTPGYTIICPGAHDPGTLGAIGGSTSSNHIEYSSGSGFTTTSGSGG